MTLTDTLHQLPVGVFDARGPSADFMEDVALGLLHEPDPELTVLPFQLLEQPYTKFSVQPEWMVHVVIGVRRRGWKIRGFCPEFHAGPSETPFVWVTGKHDPNTSMAKLLLQTGDCPYRNC